MGFLSSLVLVLAVLAAVVFSVLVLITGKGDAMSGGGSVRTTYKGKATFDDIISRATLYTGIAFMVLVLCYQVLNRPSTSVKVPTSSAPASTPVEANIPVTPVTNVPATNTPAPNTAAPSTPVPSAAATNTPAAPAAAGTNAPKAP
jgi:preprotein translocase subunit SecG